LLEHILNVADNLGKTLPDDKDGTLLTLDSFRSYLRSQEERYAKSASSQPTDQTKTPKPRDWPSVAITMEHRRDGALLQFMRVQATIDWLQSPGVGINFGAVREKAQSLQPKIIIMVRHGELNPLSDDRVYNRDEHHARHNLPSMRLSESGVQQMQALNQTLRTRKYEVVFASASPERRAIESLAFLICGFVLSSPFKIDDRLDDTDSPGPIEDNMTMGQLQDLSGNIYNDDRNERPASIVSRMQEAFKEVINRLKPGQIGTFVTHGDPSAWLTHSILNEGVIPKPEELRKMYYLEKGQAQVFVIEHTGNVLFHFKIAPTTANKK
jgi:broad specificity phosphatase PhoE